MLHVHYVLMMGERERVVNLKSIKSKNAFISQQGCCDITTVTIVTAVILKMFLLFQIEKFLYRISTLKAAKTLKQIIFKTC